MSASATERAVLKLVALSARMRRRGRMTPATIAPIFQNLRPERIPALDSRPSQLDYHNVQLAIHSLMVVNACTVHMERTPNLFTSRFLEPDGWPHFWLWIQYLHAQCIVAKVFGDSSCTSSTGAICFILSTLTSSEPFIQVLRDTPGVLALLTKLWVDSPNNVDPRESDGFFALPLGRLLPDLHTPNGTTNDIFSQVVNAVDGDVDLVVRTALDALRSPDTGTRLGNTSLAANLTLVHNLLGNPLPSPFRSAFISQGAIRQLIALLSWFISEPSRWHLTLLVELCFINLTGVMQSFGDPSWVVHALECGLLTVVLRSGPCLAQAAQKQRNHPLVRQGISLFDTFLSPYLVFRKVLRASRKALGRIEHRKLGTSAAAGPLWDPWRKFRFLAVQRLRMLDEWELKSSIHGTLACSRFECGERHEPGEMKACANCMHLLYCSHACQRLDWLNHKQFCRAGQPELSGWDNRVDRAFIMFVAQHDINLRYQDTSRVSYNDLVTQVDYARNPATFIHRPMSVYTSALEVDPQSTAPASIKLGIHAYNVAEWRDLIRRAEDSGGKRFLTDILLPRGHMLCLLPEKIPLRATAALTA
ncbi:hypothetical protein PLICRDRAFT_595097 [Plicaturopsis crispa FD-325 SS-3]|nr:hypothetical protein PLICRDRAFT_595097 [Plicaturopsis crispa FD-325 SS-3]